MAPPTPSTLTRILYRKSTVYLYEEVLIVPRVTGEGEINLRVPTIGSPSSMCPYLSKGESSGSSEIKSKTVLFLL